MLGVEVPNYHVRKLESITTKPGCWEYIRVGVFDGDNQVGEYVRHYPGFAETTFCPFVGADGNWYAMYSDDYTCTRIMALPSCQMVAGEEPHGGGFCPTEFHVPRYRMWVSKATPPDKLHNYPECNHQWLVKDRPHRDYEDDDAEWAADALVEKDDGEFRWEAGIKYDERGFVAGCVWGDDNSDKIRCFDLSRVHLGELPKAEDFGYVEMARGCTLKRAVHISENHKWVELSVRKRVKMEGGKVVERE